MKIREKKNILWSSLTVISIEINCNRNSIINILMRETRSVTINGERGHQCSRITIAVKVLVTEAEQ